MIRRYVSVYILQLKLIIISGVYNKLYLATSCCFIFFYDIYDTTRPQIYRRAPIIDSDDEKTPEPAQIVNDVQPDARLLLF
jgi:hypothetical protein